MRRKHLNVGASVSNNDQCSLVPKLRRAYIDTLLEVKDQKILQHLTGQVSVQEDRLVSPIIWTCNKPKSSLPSLRKFTIVGCGSSLGTVKTTKLIILPHFYKVHCGQGLELRHGCL